jgi:hypothetical protein
LLDVDVHVAHGAHDPSRLVRQPSRIRVGDEDVVGSEHRSDRANPLDVHARIAADLELEAPVALALVPRDLLRHLRRRVL